MPTITDSVPPDHEATLSRIVAAVLIGREADLSAEDKAVLTQIRDEAKREPATLPRVEIRDDVQHVAKESSK